MFKGSQNSTYHSIYYIVIHMNVMHLKTILKTLFCSGFATHNYNLLHKKLWDII